MSELSETLIGIGWRLTYYVTMPMFLFVVIYEVVTWRGGRR